MALFATHVRFAHDIVEELGVQDLPQYYSGSLYPDSRYMSRLSRDVTHVLPQLETATDFEKGCWTHVFFDDSSYPYYQKLFNFPESIDAFTSEWCTMTAGKMVNDVWSYGELGDNAREIFSSLPQYTHTPANEDLESLQTYQRFVQSHMRDLPDTALYKTMTLGLGISEKIWNQVHEKKEEIEKAPETIQALHDMYSSILAAAKKELTGL